MSQRHGYLSYKESSLILFEPFHFNKMSEKLAAFDEFHDKVYSEIVLEDILHVHDEGMIHLEEDVFLQLYVLKLLILHYDVFSDTFHGKNLLVLLILD